MLPAVITALHALALSLYLIAAGVLATSFADAQPVAPRTGAHLLGAGLAVHLGALVGYALTFGVAPLSGLGPALSTQAFVLGLASLAAMLARDARALGLVLTPLIAGTVAMAIPLGLHPPEEPTAFAGAWFAAHVLLAIAGYACLAVAFAAGLLYLLQFRALKGKLFGRVFRYFPALGPLDRIGRLAVLIGLPSLAAGLLLGWAWTLRYRQSLAIGDPQVIWGMVTLAAFAAVLIVRRGPGHERKAALASVVGFTVVFVCYLGLRLLMPGRGFL